MSDYQTNQPPKTLAIGVGAVSETGQREQNQDRMTGFSSPFGAVYLVADGMGGHRGGAEASRMVTEAFSRHLMAAPASSPAQDALTLAVRLTNLEVLEKGRSGNPEFEGMGSTVVIALLRDTPNGMELTTAHVGDSRIYLRRNDTLTLLTKDHTQVQWLIDSNALDEADARNHPDASVLTRAIGHTTDLQVDISGPIPLLEGDHIILCSDGLSGFANADEIDRTIAENPDPTKCANKLVHLALASGSNDNITVQVLRIGNAAQTRRRARKTEPGGKAMIRPLGRSPWILISVVVLLIAAGAIYWLHRPPGPTPVPTPDPAIHQLALRIKALQASVSTLHNKAEAGHDAIEKDLTDLGALHDEAGKPEALKKELQNLKKELGNVNKQLGDVLTSSNELDKSARTTANDLPKPETTSPPGKKTTERSAKLDQLKQALDKDENKLHEQQDNLANASSTQSDLEDRELNLKMKWKAVHPATKPMPKPLSDAPKGNKAGSSQD